MNPLKQGLKPVIMWSMYCVSSSVKEVNPLKQGLKKEIVVVQENIEFFG